MKVNSSGGSEKWLLGVRKSFWYFFPIEIATSMASEFVSYIKNMCIPFHNYVFIPITFFVCNDTIIFVKS